MPCIARRVLACPERRQRTYKRITGSPGKSWIDPRRGQPGRARNRSRRRSSGGSIHDRGNRSRQPRPFPAMTGRCCLDRTGRNVPGLPIATCSDPGGIHRETGRPVAPDRAWIVPGSIHVNETPGDATRREGTNARAFIEHLPEIRDCKVRFHSKHDPRESIHARVGFHRSYRVPHKVNVARKCKPLLRMRV